MGYVAITSSEIETGEPVTTTTLSKVRGNFSDHESRISSLETAIGAYRPIEFYVQGRAWLFGAPQSLIGFQRISFDITLTAGRVVLLQTGSSGSLEVDILYKRGVNPFASIFSTKPILTSAASQFAVNSGVISFPTLLSGDILALSISQVMTGCTEFKVEMDFST